jgi:hypothetical protein
VRILEGEKIVGDLMGFGFDLLQAEDVGPAFVDPSECLFVGNGADPVDIP